MPTRQPALPGDGPWPRRHSRNSQFTSIRIAGGVASVAPRFDQPADLREFLRGRPLGRERLEDELRRGSAEGTVDQVADQLTLGLLLGQLRLVDMGSIADIAADKPLVGHDLEHLERGGIRGWALARERLVHLADGACAALPEDPQDGEFRVCWSWRLRRRHAPHYLRRYSYMSTKIFVECWTNGASWLFLWKGL